MNPNLHTLLILIQILNTRNILILIHFMRIMTTNQIIMISLSFIPIHRPISQCFTLILTLISIIVILIMKFIIVFHLQYLFLQHLFVNVYYFHALASKKKIFLLCNS